MQRQGTDSRRLSARGQWERPFVGPLCDLFTVSTALWTDGYNVNDQTTQDRQDSYSGFSGRAFPQAGANWRLPLVRDGETVKVGAPRVAGAKVEVEVVRHGRGKKILVGKYKKRKGYRKRNGHRQDFTEVLVRTIQS